MEVVRTNFQDVMEELDKVLEEASFLCIDTEFTGLNVGPDSTPFDSPAQYYSRIRSGSMNFLLVQFGLSVFTFENKTKKYSQRSYNFYAFPHPLNRGAPDCRFICQASSISFLASQGFDFNKLFNSGIPFLTKNEEERLQKKMEDKQKIREEGQEFIPIPDHDKPQIEEILSKISEFIKSDAEKLSIDRCNAFIRRLVYQEVKRKWPKKLHLDFKAEGLNQILEVTKVGTKEEEEKKVLEQKEKERLEMKEAIGLSALLKKISSSGKLIVGHNMLLDLCHVIRQFFNPLPETYSEFKALVHGLFPKIIDTKIISQSTQLKDKVPLTNLQYLLDTCSKEPFSIPEVIPVKDRSYSTSIEKSHEAGYDAYMTGLCFIAMKNYLGTLESPAVDTVLCDSPLLNPFLNKLVIVRLKDVPHINLVGNDPTPSRDHVFYITFPREWKGNDISKLFTSYGGVFVSWLSDTSAFVSLYKRDQVKNVLKNVKNTKFFHIKKFAEHQKAIEPAEQGLRKRKLESTEIDKNQANGSEKNTEEGWETVEGIQSFFTHLSRRDFFSILVLIFVIYLYIFVGVNKK
ncbi:poly(A)-specific ribonuclease PARN-like isoform X1 [Leptopilina heterotoma]|uniref:poly(A)-specific ribonuclease PARN-like isoform X1 n=1 Tax=Leptopilina heterotoma TaxID=63436 RepID=UPI001CA8A202|nr:poly(A)-specific ribonuclease PARN-like isoform X1 [Leptopilina heterotoma]